MTDLPLSAVAWLSVVLIQAVIHFFVLGHRRNRRDSNDAELTLEESLSLAETLSLSDALDDSISATTSIHSCPDNTYQIPLSPLCDKASQQAFFSEPQEGEINISLLGKTLISERMHDDNETSQEFLDFLSHTGTELLKVSLIK